MKLIEFFSFLLSFYSFFLHVWVLHVREKNYSTLIHFNESFLCIFCASVFAAFFHYLSNERHKRMSNDQKRVLQYFLRSLEMVMNLLLMLLPARKKCSSKAEENGGEMNDIIISSLALFESCNFIIRHA